MESIVDKTWNDYDRYNGTPTFKLKMLSVTVHSKLALLQEWVMFEVDTKRDVGPFMENWTSCYVYWKQWRKVWCELRINWLSFHKFTIWFKRCTQGRPLEEHLLQTLIIWGEALFRFQIDRFFIIKRPHNKRLWCDIDFIKNCESDGFSRTCYLNILINYSFWIHNSLYLLFVKHVVGLLGPNLGSEMI